MSIDAQGTNNPSTPEFRCHAFLQMSGCTELADGSWTMSHTLVGGRVEGPGTDLTTQTLEVRVWTPDGYLLQASDATHYFDDGTTTHELDVQRLREIALDEMWFD
jgi:hypothetical protein